ncbi:MAG TPA: carboxymuconolactone decarboxylase family protein [Dehalococcoidia bacterium]
MRPLDASSVAPEQRPFVEALEAAGSFINLYGVMAQSPAAMRRFYDLASVLWSGGISDRLREVAILAVVSTSNAPYPLGWHILDGEAAGLTSGEIQAIIRGDEATCLSSDEAAVAQFARALTLEANVPDDVFDAVAKTRSEQQIVDLTMLVGLYGFVARVANALRVDLDEAPARALETLRSEQG